MRRWCFRPRRLAELVADEWRAQGDTVLMQTMPATRLAHTVVDGLVHSRLEAEAEIGRFAGSDALCYFADYPASLAARQAATWRPLMDWADEALGLTFEEARGVVHRPQPAATLERLADLLEDKEPVHAGGPRLRRRPVRFGDSRAWRWRRAG